MFPSFLLIPLCCQSLYRAAIRKGLGKSSLSCLEYTTSEWNISRESWVYRRFHWVPTHVICHVICHAHTGQLGPTHSKIYFDVICSL
ncbi:hypothetical protein IW261DRAFT_583348 [Armillaria novae-zelandiae]|uniref:Uncharacterized protein n=1 Tax=Armillaria novae-zelandiae TaxID=153914 RepID=A0AA39NYV2_9AGAR|nr:hypothetical protein IW261DRAFT_583348 [Armillaria novae-zelandiae]